MNKNFTDIISDISPVLAKLHKEIPDVMSGFSAISQAATKEGALSKKTKELMALALGIAARCEGCISFHAQTLVKLGVSKEELLETLSMATYMGGGPSIIYAAKAYQAFEEFSTKT